MGTDLVQEARGRVETENAVILLHRTRMSSITAEVVVVSPLLTCMSRGLKLYDTFNILFGTGSGVSSHTKSARFQTTLPKK
jgi:hypothetical protein